MFVLPSSFDPYEQLPKSLHRLADDARYFVSTVLTKTSRGQVDEAGNVRLMAKHLRNIMHKHRYNHVVDAMLDNGVVDRAGYLIGVKSFGYRLSERFINDKHVRVAATDRRLIQRLEAFYAEQEIDRRSRIQPVHEALERHQKRLSIDRDHAAEILMRLPPKSNPWDTQNVLIRDISDKDFHLSVGTYGRVFNNISCLKREIRQALRLGKYPLSNVDIRCCQPALLGKLAQEGTGSSAATRGACNYDAPNHGDIGDFNKLVQSGGFYEFLMEKLKNRSCPVFTRDDVKERFIFHDRMRGKSGRTPSIFRLYFRLVSTLGSGVWVLSLSCLLSGLSGLCACKSGDGVSVNLVLRVFLLVVCVLPVPVWSLLCPDVVPSLSP